LIAALEVDAGGRAGGQLEDAVSAPHKPDDSPPLWQPPIDLSHALRAVEEYRIDGEPHEHHVDAVARTQPETAAGLERAAEHQAGCERDQRGGPLEIFGKHLPCSFVHCAPSRHSDGH